MLHIKDIIQSATKEELANLGEAWEMGTFESFVSARKTQLEKVPMIHQVDHYVRLMRNVTLAPMQVYKTVSIAKILVLSKRLNVITELLCIQEAINEVEAITCYETFKQGGNRLTIGLQNGTREKIVLKKGTKVNQVAAANVVPPMFAPDLSTEETELEYMNREQSKGNILENTKVNLDENVKRPELTQERLNELLQNSISLVSKNDQRTCNRKSTT